MERKLFAGCGRGDITPAPGGQIYGYTDDEYSTGIHDPLDAKVLALSDGTERPILLVSVSVCELGTPYAMEVQEPVAAACGTTPDRVLLSCIHTHAAPNVAGMGNLWGCRDKPYFDEIFVPGIVAAAKDAVAAMQPAEYAIVKGQTEIGINRRERKLDGTVKLGQNPWGTQDKDFFVIRFRNRDTKEGIFQMVYYGCHGTAAGHAKLISRDWVGVMLDRMEQRHGMMSALWAGSIGDIGPRIPNGKTTGDIHMMEELGGFAAQEGLRIARQFKDAVYECGVPAFKSLPLEFAVRPLPSAAEVEEYLAANPECNSRSKADQLKHLYMQKCRERLKKGESNPATRTVPGAIVTLGDSVAFCSRPLSCFPKRPCSCVSTAPSAILWGSPSPTALKNTCLPRRNRFAVAMRLITIAMPSCLCRRMRISCC